MHRRVQYSCFDAAQTKDFPSEVDNVAGQKFLDCVPRSCASNDPGSEAGVLTFVFARHQRRGGDAEDPLENIGQRLRRCG